MIIPSEKIVSSWQKWVEAFRLANTGRQASRRDWPELELEGTSTATFNDLVFRAEFDERTRCFQFVATYSSSTSGNLRVMGFPKVESRLGRITGSATLLGTPIRLHVIGPIMYIGANQAWGGPATVAGSITL